MDETSNSSRQARRMALRVRAICMREIFLAYLCILLNESACLFPAVWVR